jgi:gamma-glutamylcyclotransferase (GGCT)/AIG2-like uncharacterized protein YtfP
MLRNLFVYGTLMPHIGHPMGQRLAGESRTVGQGVIEGRLLDLGAYPALIETGPGEGLVYGEVHELTDPASSLSWLDDYEGDEYERVERRIMLRDGSEVTAWVYVYRESPSHYPPIESGRWSAP